MNFILKKIVIKDFLFTAFLMLSLLFFFVDSGGVLGLRILGVVILSFYFFISILHLHKIDMHVFNISIFSLIVFITPFPTTWFGKHAKGCTHTMLEIPCSMYSTISAVKNQPLCSKSKPKPP